MARRYRQRAQQTSTDRWIVSYADFLTLLLAFFVVMYSISSVNEGKYRQLSDSLSAIFSGAELSFDPVPVGDLSINPARRDIGLLDQQVTQQPGSQARAAGVSASDSIKQIHADAKARFQELIADGQLSISANSLWLEIEIGSELLFHSGRATPQLSADAVLEALAILLKPYANPIHVEGYTDDQPVQSNLFPSNWELSAARAAGVVRMLAHFGIDSERLAAVGYGQNKPKVSNLTPRGRSKNRRVVIIVSRDDQLQRALTVSGNRHLGAAAVQEILQRSTPDPGQSAPKSLIKRVESESGAVLFTDGDRQ